VKNATYKQVRIEWRLGTILTNLEEELKQKLFDLWKKEAVRVRKHNSGWKSKKISLGYGIMKNKNKPRMQKILDTIEDFGISVEALMHMKPSYDRLFEIYESITVYRYAIRYLRNLKEHMETFQNFKEWRT